MSIFLSQTSLLATTVFIIESFTFFNLHLIFQVIVFTNYYIKQQEQYEKLMASMQERMDEVEAKLKNTRVMLQEKVNQLKEQVTRNKWL